jgi:hypothetical protein
MVPLIGESAVSLGMLAVISVDLPARCGRIVAA